MTLDDIRTNLENLVTLKKMQREVTELFIRVFPLTARIKEELETKLKNPNFVLFDNMNAMQSTFHKIYIESGFNSIIRELLEDSNFKSFNDVTHVTSIEPKMNDLDQIKNSLCANLKIFEDLKADIASIETYMTQYYDYYSRVHYTRYRDYSDKIDKIIGSLESGKEYYAFHHCDEKDNTITETEIHIVFRSPILLKQVMEYISENFGNNWKELSCLYKWIIEAKNEGLI